MHEQHQKRNGNNSSNWATMQQHQQQTPEMILKETLYSKVVKGDELFDDASNQTRLLVLVKYTLMSVDLVTLIQQTFFKETHYRFLITSFHSRINFLWYIFLFSLSFFLSKESIFFKFCFFLFTNYWSDDFQSRLSSQTL